VGERMDLQGLVDPLVEDRQQNLKLEGQVVEHPFLEPLVDRQNLVAQDHLVVDQEGASLVEQIHLRYLVVEQILKLGVEQNVVGYQIVVGNLVVDFVVVAVDLEEVGIDFVGVAVAVADDVVVVAFHS
jgi:hypothetical protein